MFSKKTRFKLMSLIIASSMFNGMYNNFNYEEVSAATVTTTVFSSSFENDDTNTWWGTGGASVTRVSTDAQGGTNCLAVTGRTKTYNGAQTDLTGKIEAGKTYKTSVWVKFQGTKALTFQVTLGSTIDGNASYKQMTDTVTVQPGQWTEVSGTFTCPSGTITQARPYVECSDATADFYIDNFSITTEKEQTSTETSNVISSGFEDGTTNWWGSGDAKISAVSTGAKNGTNCLAVTGRTATYMGPQTDITGKIEGGKKYNTSVWVKFDGTGTHKFKVTLDNVIDGKENYSQMTNQVEVTAGQWTEVTGTFTCPSGTVTKARPYVECDDATADFYIDDFNITTEASSEIGTYSQSFEKGVDSWSVRGGCAVSQDLSQYQDGSSSLKVSGRTKTWEGPIKDLTNVLTKGQSYHFSAYIMYNDEKGASNQNFNLKFENVTADGSQYADVANATVAKGTWTKIEGDYTIPSDANLSKYSLYIELPYKANENVTDTDKIDFYLDNVVISKTEIAKKDYQKDIPQLKNEFSSYFPVGTAVMPYELDSSDVHSDFIKYQYNALVAGNCMKIDALQPTEGHFAWSDADKTVKFANDNNMILRGHTLVWHSQVPNWFFQDKTDSTKPASRELLLERMKTHIDTVMGRYKGKVKYWDVVNECISNSSGLRGTSEGSKWKSIIGDVDGDGYDSDYIELAFKYAHEADPDAKLIINDYGTEGSTKKRDDLYNLIKRMLQKGIPVDGVGLQMHISMYNPSAEEIKDCIEKFASLKEYNPNFTVQVTEMDMSIYSGDNEAKKAVTNDILLQQASQYKKIFDVYKQEAAKGNLGLVMLWGNSDDNTWLDNHPVSGRTDSPLPFDRNLQAKPSFWSIVNPSSQTGVFKQKANTANGTITIGDTVDTRWQMVTGFDVDAYTKGIDGATAKVKTMWDADNLYVLANVTDKTVQDNDSVEIYVGNGNGGYNKYTVNRNTNTDTIKVIQTSTGYQIQAKLPLTGITPKIGAELGFDMKINDYDSTGNLNSSVVWNDYVSKDTLDAKNGGILSFTQESKLVKAKKGTPTIDGSIDEVWNNANVISTDVSLKDSNTAKAKVRTLWDKNYIYALYEVTDSNLDKTNANAYEQDSVETFIDENNAKTSAYDSDDAQYRVNYDNEQSGGGNRITDKFKSATKKTDTGYIVEIAIPLNNEAKANQILGFDAQVNDAAAGVRNGVNIWCDGTSQTWATLSNIGNMMLVDSEVSKGDVNGDGKVDVLDYALLQKYIKNPVSVTINTANSDVNGDSKVTIADLLALRKIILNS